MEESWIIALIGGGFIGLSATIHLLFNGRITGISGIYFGMFQSKGAEWLWRFKFILGLLLGGLISAYFLELPFSNESGRSLAAIVVAGFLVGFGTRLGSGCTSGHGVCGMSRLSKRSIIATICFMASGILTVTIISKFFGSV